MTVGKATLWTILGAYLILPPVVAVDFPLIPPLDKSTIPNISALIGCWFIKGKRIQFLPKSKVARWLIIIFILSPFITVLLNPDPIIAGSTFLKGMEYYDALSAVIRQILFMLPFAFGFTFFRTERDLENILKVCVISGLIYSLPMLLEIRLSPQLNRWVYGFHPGDFIQNVRQGGFRPVVFIGHGLAVAYFIMTALVSAVTLHRIRLNVLQMSARNVVMFLGVMLILCKSVGSVIYAAIILSAIYFAKPTRQVKVACFLVMLAVSYPILRVAELVPIYEMVEVAESISEDRAQSLNFRFRNEEMLLSKAMQRSFFGWGSWGRNRVYDHRGKDISVTDGRWVITLGIFGLFGYIAEFGLLALPVFRCARVMRKIDSRRGRIVLSALVLLLAINMVDLLPNSTITPFSWLLAGTLLGYAEAVKSQKKALQKIATQPSATSIKQ